MLQHVFESARKLGLPIIVTDPSGRDPMVVLPLDQFEAMAEGTPVDRRASLKPAPILGGMTSPMPVLEDLPPSVQENAEITLDERFYLEPVDDESKA